MANIIEDGRLAGPQRRIIKVAVALRGKQIETLVVIPTSNSESFKELLKVNSILFKELPIRRLGKDFKGLFIYMLYFFYELVILIKFFRKEKFDIVHVSGGAWQVKGVIAGFLSMSKVVWHLNDTKMPKVVRFIFYCLSGMSHGMIFAGERARSYYSKISRFPKVKKFVIQAPVDDAKLNIQYSRPKEFPVGRSVVITVANVSPIKGLERFIEIASQVVKINNKVDFWIVGPILQSQQKYHQKLLALVKRYAIEGNVHFLGACDEVENFLAYANIYMCTSIAEASPTAVWEAMLMQLPVVSTDVGDVSRFIKSGINGYVIGEEDIIAAMKGAVLDLLSNNKKCVDFGLKARQIALQNLTVAKVARDHETAYKALLE